jgi:predicted molibdopterin-dependent oxidoreductase YjgC
VVGLATVFGAGGGTSSYEEAQAADLIVMWGSNARNAHPIFFHHVLKALHSGARLYSVDPRRSETAQFADRWLGLHVGTDIALSHTIAREIIHAGLARTDFIERATTGYDEYAASVEPWTLERGEAVTGVPAEAIRDLAHAYATAEAAQLCWTLGITEHHNGVDNVLSLCNLALLTGQVGRFGAGLTPLRGQNNVQGGGDMGALPNKLPGFQDVEDDVARAKFERTWGTSIPSEDGWHLTEMFEAMEHDELKALFVIGENPAQSEADSTKAIELLSTRDHLVVLDIYLTKTAELADVVLPAAAWGEKTGTFTNADRTVHLSEQAVDPPGEARTDLEIWIEYARRMNLQDADGQPLVKWSAPEEAFDHFKRLTQGRPCDYSGMSYDKLRTQGQIQWPCNDQHPDGAQRLYEDLVFNTDPDDCEEYGHDLTTGAGNEEKDYRALNPAGRAILKAADYSPPHELPTEDYPLLLTTGRTVYHFHTRTKTGRSRRLQEAAPEVWVEVSATDAERLGIGEGDLVRAESRRGSLQGRARIGDIRRGVVFVPFHYGYWDRQASGPDGDGRAANELTVSDWDPVSKQPYFKVAAVRLVRVEPADGQQAPAPEVTA